MSDFEGMDLAERLADEESELTNLAVRRLLALGRYFPTMQEIIAAEEEKQSATKSIEPLDNRGNA